MSGICECGVVVDLDQSDLCSTCAAAPHERECYCDECCTYWKRIAEESEVAAEKASRALVCTCGWTGPFIEHHRERRAECIVTYRVEAA